jgi:hypothetical protein
LSSPRAWWSCQGGARHPLHHPREVVHRGKLGEERIELISSAAIRRNPQTYARLHRQSTPLSIASVSR